MTDARGKPGRARRAKAPHYSRLVLDLDGTLLRGQETTPFAVEVVNGLRSRAELLFLSNNSSLSRRSMVARLRELGFDAREEEAISSADLLCDHLSTREPHAPFYPVCSRELEELLVGAGHRSVSAEEAKYVLVGVDWDLTYAKLAGGLRALRRGAALLAANLDRVFPVEGDVLPGAGAVVGAFRGMGFEPDVLCGKPDPRAIERALALRGFARGPDLLMVGDQVETDVLGALRLGIDSALVLTGASTEADVERLGIRPTYVIPNLSGLGEILRGEPGD